MSSFAEKARSVSTRADLVELVRELKKDLDTRPEHWVNAELGAFLEAMAAWIEDMDGYYVNLGEKVPTRPEWRTLADMLMGARTYE